MKKQYVFSIVTLFIIFVAVFLIMNRNTEFERLKEQRENIAQMVANGEISVQENGIIVLPENMNHLSESGECVLATFNSQKAIYFYSYRGILDSSKGYLFVFEKLNDISAETMSDCFTNCVEIEPNWYKCSTSYD